MVCPKCGTDIPEGRLYCPKCGESIQMVPDFEPDIEENLAETRNDIAGAMEDIKAQEPGERTADLSGITREIAAPDKADAPEGRKKDRRRIIFFSVLLLCIIIIAMVPAVMHFTSTYSAHMDRAASYMSAGRYEKAAAEYQAAALKKPNDTASRIGAAEALEKSGDDDGAISCLNEAIAIDSSSEAAYNLIITIYRDRGDYTAINKLIASCSDDSIFEKYSEYLALPPEFSEDAGKYDSLFTLTLSTDESNGTIYYTTDGSTPDIHSRKYSGGIALKEGSNIVSAICINTKGFISATVTNEYDITLAVPDAPKVTPASGSFIIPENIVVSVSDNDKVYYTTDGSVPTEASLPYDGEIPMPLGQSTLSFIVKAENGKISDVTTVNYDLNYTGQCKPEEAVNYLVATLIIDGSLLDTAGHVAGSSGLYTYSCSSCARVGSRVYYMINENYNDPGGTPEPTGTMYALDSTALGLYKASRDTNGGFVFEMFY